jgi:cobalt-zinc-cadmium efflux system membrane fusion protein
MKWIILAVLLMAGICSFAQSTAADPLACDCPDCREQEAAGNPGFTLPGLDGLKGVPETEPEECADHEHADQAGHAHAETSEQEGHEPHAVHDHDDHGHGHDEAVELNNEVADEAEIKVREATGGAIEKVSTFPAEIKLNRDRTAAVSSRYASVIRQVFAEIGDEVRKGDVLASLENRETLAVYTVTAPLDGVVIAKNLSVGETADAGKVLYEVADLSSVWADISIFPQYQHLVRRGMPVEFIAHDGHMAHGSVKYISPIVSHETRTFTARCVLKGAGSDFTPGAFVRARIATRSANVAVRIEQAAVQVIDGETIVFIPVADGYEPVAVETGLADDHFIEIRHGLEAGDRYAASGAFSLKAALITSGMDPHAGHNH